MNYIKGRVVEIMTLGKQEALMDLNFRYRMGILTQCEDTSSYVGGIRPISKEALINDKILVSNDFINNYGISKKDTILLNNNRRIVDLSSCVNTMNISAERLLIYFRLDRTIKYRMGKLHYRPRFDRYNYELIEYEKQIENIFYFDENTKDFYEMLLSGTKNMINLVEFYIYSLRKILDSNKIKFSQSKNIESWHYALKLLKAIRNIGAKPDDTQIYIDTAKEVAEFIRTGVDHIALKELISVLFNKICY